MTSCLDAALSVLYDEGMERRIKLLDFCPNCKGQHLLVQLEVAIDVVKPQIWFCTSCSWKRLPANG